ncbi:MAG TPA: Na-translocating system protein MpsB, partial [Burkholderiales bacterium]|nr:Na-translocating system protein MpsB [Burkholderiales bacterium]
MFFDKDRGGELLVRASGGAYLELRRGEASGMSPLRGLKNSEVDREWLKGRLKAQILSSSPVYSIVDELWGTQIGNDLNELLIKSCLDFFDEGQSVWQMPGRERGLFSAWSQLARSNLRLFIRGLHIKKILGVDDTPEGIISHVMNELGVPEDDWLDCFTSELTRLHGWAGFIRWRSSAKDYHWSRNYPADLVDYLAIRLVLGLALLKEHAQRKGTPSSLAEILRLVEEDPEEYFLRYEFYCGKVVPELAREVEDAVSGRSSQRAKRLLPKYLELKRGREARLAAEKIRALADASGMRHQVEQLPPEALDQLISMLADFEQEEGRMWLNAQESRYMNRLMSGLNLDEAVQREKRPFAQMLFCIDVRSERIRRHLEKVGDYQTYGIAGFFGIPVGFIGLEKGSETRLCPVVVSPKNLVLELAIARSPDEQAIFSVLEHVVHELKASILSPFITVEAIGLLFGLDMFGKSLAPLAYNRWRQRLHPEK